MADNFNMKQFLMENKLGAYSKLKEEKVEEVEKEEEGKMEEAKEEEQFSGVNEEFKVGDKVVINKNLTRYDKVAHLFSVGDKYKITSIDKEKQRATISKIGDSLRNYSIALKAIDPLKEDTVNEDQDYLPPTAVERMDGLVPQTPLKALLQGAQAIIRDFQMEGFEDDEIFNYIMSKIKTLG